MLLRLQPGRYRGDMVVPWWFLDTFLQQFPERKLTWVIPPMHVWRMEAIKQGLERRRRQRENLDRMMRDKADKTRLVPGYHVYVPTEQREWHEEEAAEEARRMRRPPGSVFVDTIQESVYNVFWNQGPEPPRAPAAAAPQWKCIFDQVHCEWMESVQLVFDYFCERTPRSFVEARETSLVWNYKYADVEFGRIQARDLLQHLWTGPISNAPVEIIQGGKSVEGNRRINLTNWKRHPQLGHVRDLQFQAPIKGAFGNWGVSQTACYQSQRRVETGEEGSTYSPVNMRWPMVPSSGIPNCRMGDPAEHELYQLHAHTFTAGTRPSTIVKMLLRLQPGRYRGDMVVPWWFLDTFLQQFPERKLTWVIPPMHVWRMEAIKQGLERRRRQRENLDRMMRDKADKTRLVPGYHVYVPTEQREWHEEEAAEEARRMRRPPGSVFVDTIQESVYNVFWNQGPQFGIPLPGIIGHLMFTGLEPDWRALSSAAGPEEGSAKAASPSRSPGPSPGPGPYQAPSGPSGPGGGAPSEYTPPHLATLSHYHHHQTNHGGGGGGGGVVGHQPQLHQPPQPFPQQHHPNPTRPYQPYQPYQSQNAAVGAGLGLGASARALEESGAGSGADGGAPYGRHRCTQSVDSSGDEGNGPAAVTPPAQPVSRRGFAAPPQ
ncbi:Alpha,alpha-trehalose-phosphate synthase [UDP-forming] 1 [Tetrabaena socialis]|uniref:Alpha,alpha-trehalose-phosphate synthase [UDP-forming] 1 n=1 Tax=Tetrabaena socialis TaxID=47790 RepID=A0A2J7ZPJ6_9CHLO|nr:Alpha,alpha-trehalose-phosphate synthase [UDP-forming] 1 [Tetrabaena socialis]|eukprot:PNH02189.1 Alpha,alpha-trehalose-phosphate synthase [UDP-forming] 1 [Tetrabaena socialis]